MLEQRVLSAAILVPLVALAVYLGGPVLLVLLLVAGLGAGYEYLRLWQRRGLHPSPLILALLIALFMADGQWPHWGLLGPTLVLVPAIGLAAETRRGNAPGSVASWALAVAGGIYLGYALSYFLRLRALDLGLEWVTVALLGTWISDSGAYFVGRAWGQRPFFSTVSPKKTLEGAIGGLASGMISVALLAWWLLGLGLGWGVLVGLLLSLAATFGDLAESLIKRQVGAKDSGSLIPGHGGLLDRVDSLLFVVPVVYYLARLLPGI